MINLEQDFNIENTEELKKEYKRIIKKFNTLANQYTRIKTITENAIYKQELLQQENKSIKLENEELQKENNYLRNFLEKTYEYVSILFDFPKDRLKRLVKDFINKIKEW